MKGTHVRGARVYLRVNTDEQDLTRQEPSAQLSITLASSRRSAVRSAILRSISSSYYDRIVDVMELVRFTVLMRPHAAKLVDRYSGRKSAGVPLARTTDLATLAISQSDKSTGQLYIIYVIGLSVAVVLAPILTAIAERLSLLRVP